MPATSIQLHADINFALKHVGFRRSEFAACENFIYPILREVWKNYLDDLMVWSHQPIFFDAELSGTPDYFVARRSPLGPDVVDKPYLMVVEAKKDDFELGWGQCLAAMVAALKINQVPEQTVYGIATTGVAWEFAKLKGDQFTRDLRVFTLADLAQLLGAVHYHFEQCKQELVTLAALA